ncbi:MAG: cytochrome c peroxidase [Pseudomonadota bacterium]
MRLTLALLLLASPLAAQQHPLPEPHAEFVEVDMDEVRLGHQLFYDPILSGNKTVSCATCHHPRFGTGDGLSLGLGDGGIGLGPERVADADNLPEQRIPRNAPALWNLGAVEFTRQFHDGRLEEDPTQPDGLRSPLGGDLTNSFDTILQAQATFPVLSPDEMAGHYSENEVSRLVRQGRITGEGGAWEALATRVATIPAYSAQFEALGVAQEEITFRKIADAIAAFMAFEWRADNSPFDQYLRDGTPLEPAAQRGMDLFYGKANCAACHSGLFQTDHNFHAIAMPQIGPGKAARFENHQRDVGRGRVTGRAEDMYRFRTPSLRNVALTAPYGHAGTYATLDSVIRHHLNPVASLHAYDPSQAILPALPGKADFAIISDVSEINAIAAANELGHISLSDTEITDLIAFLHALTDDTQRLGVPKSVPSGLHVDQ